MKMKDLEGIPERTMDQCGDAQDALPPSMVERVARAMAVADGCGPDDPAYVRYPGGHAFGLCWRDKYAAKARAAIEAMREPTEAMRHAYPKAAFGGPFATKEDSYRAMIDAALADAPVEASPRQADDASPG